MDSTNAKPYKLSPVIVDIIEKETSKYKIPAAEYISLCIRFCYKTDFVPDESTLKNSKLTSKFRYLNELKKIEKNLSNMILELRNTQVSFIKQQEKDLLKPMLTTINDVPKILEYNNLKLINIFIETLVEDERTRMALRKKFVK